MMLPLLLAVVIAHAFTVLTLRRSILTEKVARRGYHLSREYTVDPLEILFVREVMHSDGEAPVPEGEAVAYPDEPLRAVVYRMADTGITRMPVVNPDDPGKRMGVVSLEDLLRARTRTLEEERRRERVIRMPFERPEPVSSNGSRPVE
jgi:CBS-domain-containing membrane protein